MERLRPPDEDPSKAIPLFVCSSIEDLLTSRDEIIQEMEYWQKNEASIITKLKYPNLSNTGSISFLFGIEKETAARVFILQLNRIPAIDETVELKPDEITIWDGVNSLIIDLPIKYVFEKRNVERIQNNEQPVYVDQLRGQWGGRCSAFG